MKNTLFMLLAITVLCGSLTLGQPPQTPPPSAPQQPTDVRIVITGGAQPKLGIAGFVPLSSDAETVAAALANTDGGRLARPPAARAGSCEARAAERPAAGRAGRLASGFGQVQLVVADEADPIEAEARLA